MGFMKTIIKEFYGRAVKRRVQEFNIENRAFKLLDKDKLPSAPGHVTEQNALRNFFQGIFIYLSLFFSNYF